MKCLRSCLGLGILAVLCLFSGVAGKTGRLYGNPEAAVPAGPAGCALGPGCLLPPPELPPPEALDPPTPVVKLRIRVPACASPGQPIEYHIRVQNCSAADAHHVLVKNPLPANAKFVRASPEPHVKEPEIQWKLGTVKAEGGCDILLVLQPTNKEDVNNCTRVQFEHGQCVTTRLASAFPPGVHPDGDTPPMPPPDQPMPPPDQPVPPVTPRPDELAKLTLSIDGPKKQYVNIPTSYFLTVKNTGKSAATNLLVDFTLASKTVFVKANEEGKFLAGKVAWVLGTLEPGASKTVVAVVKSEALGELCHQGQALADFGVKAQAEICTIFAGVSALLPDLIHKGDPIPVGGDTSFLILIKNTGTAPVTNLNLKAFIPDALQLSRTRPADHRLGDPVAGGKMLQFPFVPNLAVGETKEFEVFVRALKPGDARFRIEVRADQLEKGAVIQEESARVYAEENGVSALPQSRRETLPIDQLDLP